MKKLSLFLILIFFGMLMAGNAFAVRVSWQPIDWRAWGSLYEYNAGSDTFVTQNSNPYNGTTSQNLPNGVWKTGDSKEDAFGIAQIRDIYETLVPANKIWKMSAAQEITVFFWGADDRMMTGNSTLDAVLYTSGFVAEFWLDTNPNYNYSQLPSARTAVNQFPTVTDGVKVLSVMGHLLKDPISGNTYDVKETANPDTGGFSGTAFLDVIGGLWAPYYDTNTFTPLNSASGGPADMRLVFSTLPLFDDSPIGWTSTNWVIEGNGTLQSNLIPEPTTMVLMGIGLLGLASLSRKRFLKK